MRDQEHPFYPFDEGYTRGQPQITNSAIRCEIVSEFSLDECKAALANKNISLKQSVVNRLRQRIRKLERAG